MVVNTEVHYKKSKKQYVIANSDAVKQTVYAVRSLQALIEELEYWESEKSGIDRKIEEIKIQIDNIETERLNREFEKDRI
jgi:hypothetical protein